MNKRKDLAMAKKTTSQRLDALEQALIQINHATTVLTDLDLPAWKATMNADMKWVKLGLKLATAGAWISPIAAALLLKALLS